MNLLRKTTMVVIALTLSACAQVNDNFDETNEVYIGDDVKSSPISPLSMVGRAISSADKTEQFNYYKDWRDAHNAEVNEENRPKKRITKTAYSAIDIKAAPVTKMEAEALPPPPVKNSDTGLRIPSAIMHEKVDSGLRLPGGIR